MTDAMRQQALESLIEERVLITYARDSGMRVDDAEVDRAVQSVAAQNQLSLDQLRERLRIEGLDYTRFRASLRDQILIERVREREVGQRTRVPDAEIDKYLAERKAPAPAKAELNIAQILVTVPEGADADTWPSARHGPRRRWRACGAAKTSPPWHAKCPKTATAQRRRDRPAAGDRLPDAFVEQARTLKPGQVSPSCCARVPAGTC